MADTSARRLPRGRHRLSREQVETDQRLRIAAGLVEAMGSEGYVGTSVADIIGRAGVSRETFYRLFDDKQDCFLATFDLVAAITGDSFGETNMISALIYVVVGVSALALVPTLFRWVTADSSTTTA